MTVSQVFRQTDIFAGFVLTIRHAVQELNLLVHTKAVKIEALE